MVLYNFGAVVTLCTVAVQLQPVGVALWPAIVLHAVMTTWSVRCLLGKSTQINEKPK